MKKYLITDPLYYTSAPKIFFKKLLHVVDSIAPDFICLRDKETNNYRDLAVELKKIDIKSFLHTDFRLASELSFYGVHFSSTHSKSIKKAKKLGLHVVVSTHSLKEALHAQSLGADFITYSPIFETPNKAQPVGLVKLKEINDKIDIECFALGGVVEDEQILACKKTGVYGFASIRYFVKKGRLDEI
jgi:thiamine-phosphate pyrophosphorylase